MDSVVPARRRTPDHPPYALMIGAAIRSLAEEGGSTEESISRFIRSNYGDIPPAHDLLLPYYLAKLTACAEFAISTPGRYVVPRHVGGEGEEGAHTDIEEGLPLVCDGDVVMPVQALPAKRKRGRPPKEKTVTCPEDGVVGLSSGPLVPVERETDTVVRKRRGRKPKVKTESVATAGKPGKRPGRPPRYAKKPDEDEPVSVTPISAEKTDKDENEPAVPTAEKTAKRRWRPPKSAKKPEISSTVTTEKNCDLCAMSAPNSVEMSDKDGPEMAVMTAGKTGKRRGRPPKRKAGVVDRNPENS